jgi:hypothetical protein
MTLLRLGVLPVEVRLGFDLFSLVPSILTLTAKGQRTQGWLPKMRLIIAVEIPAPARRLASERVLILLLLLIIFLIVILILLFLWRYKPVDLFANCVCELKPAFIRAWVPGRRASTRDNWRRQSRRDEQVPYDDIRLLVAHLSSAQIAIDAILSFHAT